MLILTRFAGQSIIIDGEKIEIVVLGIKGNQVRIGINAPKDISIYREELLERIKLEKEENRHEQ